MPYTIEWQMDAEILSPLVHEGQTYLNVPDRVTWTCTLRDEPSGYQATASGTDQIPRAVGVTVDIDGMSDLPPEQRKAQVRDLANAIKPNFADEVEARLSAELDAKLATPQKSIITLL